ncbi:transposable element Tc1 transposase [Trichonephila clavata]|uniref:Transposable element Tc1 transposase n=1 Tax=Trichonephila clavata TaxID=2740835 RepID=A0A8X6I149_TRICU|nr:transposable element Tc1 transposase [Trichonephila clavata]
MKRKNSFFLQDLSSVHTSRYTTLWLQELNVNVMHDWPPKDLDMNPMENVWAELVRRLEIHWSQMGVRNRDQLWEDVLQVFLELPKEYFENLIRSMPRRVRTVSSKHGGWAKVLKKVSMRYSNNSSSCSAKYFQIQGLEGAHFKHMNFK